MEFVSKLILEVLTFGMKPVQHVNNNKYYSYIAHTLKFTVSASGNDHHLVLSDPLSLTEQVPCRNFLSHCQVNFTHLDGNMK